MKIHLFIPILLALLITGCKHHHETHADEAHEQEMQASAAHNHDAIHAAEDAEVHSEEGVVGEQFQGITVGISIPLWENKNSVKYAKALEIERDLNKTVAELLQYE